VVINHRAPFRHGPGSNEGPVSRLSRGIRTMSRAASTPYSRAEFRTALRAVHRELVGSDFRTCIPYMYLSTLVKSAKALPLAAVHGTVTAWALKRSIYGADLTAVDPVVGRRDVA
jgi:hypothetical protein